MATPPGITEREFARALEELRNAVGAEWVFSSDEDMNLYRDAYSPFKNASGNALLSPDLPSAQLSLRKQAR